MSSVRRTRFTQGQGRRIKAAFIASNAMRDALIKGETGKAINCARIIRDNRDVFDAAGILIEREMAWLDMMERYHSPTGVDEAEPKGSGCLPCQTRHLTKMDIDKPPLRDDHPDRVISCQEAMEKSLAELIETATAAGWKFEEVIAAISELADNLMLAHQANADTESSIEQLRRLT